MTHPLARLRALAVPGAKLAALPAPASAAVPAALPASVHGAGPGQRRALGRVLRFFAGMLALTLLARGMAGAALPRVTLGRAGAGTLTDTLKTDGTVTAAGSLPVSLPARLYIQEVPAAAGQTVAAGDTIAVVDTDQLALAIAEQQAALAGLEARLARLADAEPLDETRLAEAGRALAWAQQDYDAIAGQDHPDPAALTSAQRALDSANAALEAERAACVRQQAQLELTARENAAEAAALRIERDAAQKTLAELQALAKNEGRLLSPMAGLLLTLSLQPGETAGPDAPAATLVDPQAGFLLRFSLTEEQAKQAKVGQTVRVTQGDRTADVPLVALGAPDAGGRTEAAARLEGEGWRCAPAACELTLSSRRYDCLLPAGAVQSGPAGDCVYTVEQRTTLLGVQQVLVRLPVTVLASAGGRVAVEGALAPDAEIVFSSTGALAAGGRVRLAE